MCRKVRVNIEFVPVARVVIVPVDVADRRDIRSLKADNPDFTICAIPDIDVIKAVDVVADGNAACQIVRGDFRRTG